MNSGLAGFFPCDFGTVEKPFLMTLARGALHFFAVWWGELWNLRTETNGQLCCGRDAPLGGDVVHVGFVKGDGGHMVTSFRPIKVVQSLRGRGKVVVETRI